VFAGTSDGGGCRFGKRWRKPFWGRAASARWAAVEGGFGPRVRRADLAIETTAGQSIARLWRRSARRFCGTVARTRTIFGPGPAGRREDAGEHGFAFSKGGTLRQLDGSQRGCVLRPQNSGDGRFTIRASGARMCCWRAGAGSTAANIVESAAQTYVQVASARSVSRAGPRHSRVCLEPAGGLHCRGRARPRLRGNLVKAPCLNEAVPTKGRGRLWYQRNAEPDCS